MSRPAHLPPRCPSQSRLPSPRVTTDSASQTPFRDDESQHSKHRRSPSQGSTFDDLLINLEATPRGLFLRRASSDPTSIMEVLDNPIPSISVSQPSVKQPKDAKTGCGFEADYVYGPNSPRQKGKLTQSESSMVSALLETVPQNPLRYLAVDVTGGLITEESDIKSEDHSVGGDDSDKARRRHSGQRSRVRKLQYIAELEKTVDALQTLEAELAAKVETLSQERVALSIENKKLKWQLLNLHQEKIRKDCQYLSLKNEVDKLKMVYGKHRRSKSSSFFEMNPVQSDPLMLDMGKLSLAGGSPVSLRHGFNH